MSIQRRDEVLEHITRVFKDFKAKDILDHAQQACADYYEGYRARGPDLNEDYFSWLVDRVMWDKTCTFSCRVIFVCHR